MLCASGDAPHQKGNLYGLRILHFELQLFAESGLCSPRRRYRCILTERRCPLSTTRLNRRTI